MPVFCNRKFGSVKTIYREEYRALLAALVEARKSKGLTQQDLAARLGKPQSYVSKFENGERRIDVIEFLEITKAMGVGYEGILEKLKI